MLDKETARARVANILQGGIKNVTPKAESMARAMAQCYIDGFKDCWELLMGEKLDA